MDDGYVDTWKELLETTDWDTFGRGKDPRCDNCMAHCGYVEERVVAEPFPRLVERDEIERRRVRGAVVGRVRDLVKVRELAEPELVRDLARLGVAKVVQLRRLVLGERLERAAREPGVDGHALQARDQAVAAEEPDEPRHPRGGHPDVGRAVVVVEAERSEVLDRLPVEPVDLLVRRGELGRALLPLPLERVERELPARVVAAVERLEGLVRRRRARSDSTSARLSPGASAISKVMRPLA